MSEALETGHYGPVLRIGRAKQLLVDNWIIEDAWQAPRKVHPPRRHSENPLIVGDHPWEDNKVFLYGSVREGAEGRLRMWYNAVPMEAGVSLDGNVRPQYRVCYAESSDGVHWEKPSLGLCEWRGSRDNNIVIGTHHQNEQGEWLSGGFPRSVGPEGFCLLEEPGPAANDGLLHAFYLNNVVDLTGAHPKGGICHAVSEDGLRWRRALAGFMGLYGWSDTFNNLVWNPGLGKYVLYCRPVFYAGPAKRRVALSVSEDLAHWTQSRIALFADEADPPVCEFYNMLVVPYEGLWLGFLCVAHWDRGVLDIQLAHSRDGLTWERLPDRQPLFPLGEEGAFDSHRISLGTPLLRGRDRLMFYYSGCDGSHFNKEFKSAIGLAWWRVDGFISRRAEAEGQILTRPFLCEGNSLYVNAAASPGGSIAAEVMSVDAASGDHLRSSQVVEGMSRGDCVPVSGDTLDGAILWKDGRTLAALRGKPIRLKFHLSLADLYAFRLGD